MAFFESCLQNYLKQLSSFENNMAKERNNDLVLATLQMAHVMKRKRPYTELESVVINFGDRWYKVWVRPF